MDTRDLITIDPEVLGGTPVFKGTRVPVKTLFEYLEDNYTLDEFLECFPSVTANLAQRIGPLRGRAALTRGCMKILLDECVPWPMHKLLAGHECTTAQQRGWNGVKNGELLTLAEGEFSLFITADQNIQYQQALAGRRIAILQLSTNKLRLILAAAASIQSAVAAIPAWRVPSIGDSTLIARNITGKAG